MISWRNKKNCPRIITKFFSVTSPGEVLHSLHRVNNCIFSPHNDAQILSVSETPSETAARTLKLIAKALQNLANLVEFGVKVRFVVYLFSSANQRTS